MYYFQLFYPSSKSLLDYKIMLSKFSYTYFSILLYSIQFCKIINFIPSCFDHDHLKNISIPGWLSYFEKIFNPGFQSTYGFPVKLLFWTFWTSVKVVGILKMSKLWTNFWSHLGQMPILWTHFLLHFGQMSKFWTLIW